MEIEELPWFWLFQIPAKTEVSLCNCCKARIRHGAVLALVQTCRKRKLETNQISFWLLKKCPKEECVLNIQQSSWKRLPGLLPPSLQFSHQLSPPLPLRTPGDPARGSSFLCLRSFISQHGLPGFFHFPSHCYYLDAARPRKVQNTLYYRLTVGVGHIGFCIRPVLDFCLSLRTWEASCRRISPSKHFLN